MIYPRSINWKDNLRSAASPYDSGDCSGTRQRCANSAWDIYQKKIYIWEVGCGIRFDGVHHQKKVEKRIVTENDKY